MTKSPPSPDGPRWKRQGLHERAGSYSRRTGAPKAVAARQGRSVRWIHYVNSGERHGPPQALMDWIDRLHDGGSTSAYPLAVMVLERVQERAAGQYEGDLIQRWRELCERETRKQGSVDLRQLAIRGVAESDNAQAVRLFEEFCDLASRQAAVLLEMCGIARVEIERRGES